MTKATETVVHQNHNTYTPKVLSSVFALNRGERSLGGDAC